MASYKVPSTVPFYPADF